MTTTAAYRVKCDGPDCPAAIGMYATAAEARAIAKRMGWTRKPRTQVDLCFSCSNPEPAEQ